jgi:ligand-binding sensor domain-containing protein/two-component sensor histidine kinase
MRKILIVTSFALLLLNSISTMAQLIPQLQFQQLTQKDGLSSNLVQTMAEDSKGFIWVGTANGLNRLDGYRVKQFYHNETDSSSLADNRVFNLFCDSKGRLWAGTTTGASCLLPGSSQFINYTNQEKAANRRMETEAIPRFYEDEAGRFFLINPTCGIYELNKDLSLSKTTIQPTPFLYAGQTTRYFFELYRDSLGNEWARAGQRLFLLDKKSKTAIRTYDFKDQFVHPSGITGFYFLPGNRYFITAWNNGLFEFFPETGKLISLPQTFSRDKITGNIITWKYNNQPWICFPSVNSGLVTSSPDFKSAHVFKQNAELPNSISGNYFSSCFTDTKNNLWIATNSGLNRVKATEPFTILPLVNPGQKPFSAPYNGAPFAFAQVGDQYWINKRYNGTFVLDTNLTATQFYFSLYPLSATRENATFAAYEFREWGNDLFITTDSGMVVYNKALRQTSLVFPAAFSRTADLRNMVPLNDEEALVRSYGSGLFVFNFSQKKFTRYFKNSDSCSTCLPITMNWIGKTRNGRIFLTSADQGLLEYIPATGKFLRLSNEDGPTSGWKIKGLSNFIEDAEGLLWITSNDGLFVYDPEKGKVIRHITENSRMGALLKIVLDDKGNTWASGFSGIWCLIKEKNKWIRFDKEDGLPGNDFINGLFKDKNGRVWAGVEGGAAVFYPDRLSTSDNQFTVAVTEAAIGGHNAGFIEAHGNRQLYVPPGTNNITIDFAITEYLNSRHNHYWYQLAPLMKAFEENPDGHLNFTGLTPGKYTLYVKGSDRYGNFFSGADQLLIIIQPYWYQTLLFKLLTGLLIAAAVFLFVRWRIAAVRRQARFKQKIAETEMQALRAQMNPHFIFNSLNSIENFIMQNEKRLASDYLNKFARLIRMILDSSRNELVPFAKDMEALQLYIDLEQLRFNNKFSYENHTDPALLNGDYKVPSLLIQPYVENAIVHGLAHSENGNLRLSVQALLENDTIKYIIEDNGIGRQQAAAYNQQNKPHHQSVGLQITADRINIFNDRSTGKGHVIFTDLFDEKNNAAGTRVELTIKAF